MGKFDNIFGLKYELKNPFIREWSIKYGVINCMSNVRCCLMSGFGFLGGQRIDKAFFCSLSQNDKEIYKRVIDFIEH
jgi:hypothetical protein